MDATLAVLVVIAHPDDETLFAGFIHALTHKIKATVDLVCITNGEGGFRHSAPSECFYDNLPLSTESVGRQHLPRIRKQELLASGRILGIRKFFFYDQLDLKKDLNVDIVFAEQWDKEWVIELLTRTIKTANGTDGYDLMLVMLPDVASHGHHSASGLLALETIERLRKISAGQLKIPTVIGGSEFALTKCPEYLLNPLAAVAAGLPNEFQFDRTWKLSSSSDVPDYHLIVLWACSEHKSQGSLIAETLTSDTRGIEQYFYFAINNDDNDGTGIRIQRLRDLFARLNDIHQYNIENVLWWCYRNTRGNHEVEVISSFALALLFSISLFIYFVSPPVAHISNDRTLETVVFLVDLTLSLSPLDLSAHLYKPLGDVSSIPKKTREQRLRINRND